MRQLTILKKEKRAEALAKIEAQIYARRRERETDERVRRENAATGIYRCLLELKQPVQAAEAARVRLRMCDTEDDRRLVGWSPFTRQGRHLGNIVHSNSENV